MVKLGGLTLTGSWAYVVLLVLLGLIIAFLVYVKPTLRAERVSQKSDRSRIQQDFRNTL